MRGNSAQVAVDTQRAYIERIEASGFDYSLAVADAFIRGMRDIGYKSVGSALDELVDNALQAEATKIAVVTAPDDSDRHVERVAVIDNGHGMEPEMIRLAVVWGGSHRENDRSGFGRYGYGLPSAAVSIGRRFTVYSQVAGGAVHSVTLDIDDISDGRYADRNTGKITVPMAQNSAFPEWALRAGMTRQRRLHHGTIVVIEKLDRIYPLTLEALTTQLGMHFGAVYRNFLDHVRLTVDGPTVAPIDPLFVTPSAAFYGEDSDRANLWNARTIGVKDFHSGRPIGDIRMRASSLPPTFGSVEKRKAATRGNQNSRFAIMKEHNGLIVLRNGRQIDVVTRGLDTTFVNNDRYWKVEIDFDATLDELFSVTTSKQQIVLTDQVHALLKEEGLYLTIKDLRDRYRLEQAFLHAEPPASDGRPRRSEVVMAEIPVPSDVNRVADAHGNGNDRFEAEVIRLAETNGASLDEVRMRLARDVARRPYRVIAGALPGAPFFRIDRIGTQTALYLNAAHRFYTDLYAAPDTTPRLRSALEVLLFVLGEREFVAADGVSFYRSERQIWSARLEAALAALEHAYSDEDLLEVNGDSNSESNE